MIRATLKVQYLDFHLCNSFLSLAFRTIFPSKGRIRSARWYLRLLGADALWSWLQVQEIFSVAFFNSPASRASRARFYAFSLKGFQHRTAFTMGRSLMGA